jgi:YfiR/HmsC-like
MREQPSVLSKYPGSSAVWTICLAAWMFILAVSGRAQIAPTEYQIKAAFLFNFAKFVDWPATPDAPADSPIVIGVLGENVFHDDLQAAINGKKVNNHALQFRQYDSILQATNCQILFISPSEKNHFARIVSQLNKASVLTVSESDHFIEAGGMINFVILEKKVRFEINNEAAKKAGLTISSKLLSLAVHSK